MQHIRRCNIVGHGLSRKGRTNDNGYTNMASTTWVSSSVRDVNAMPTAVDTTARSTDRSSRKQALLVQNRKLMLAAWKVTGNSLRWKEFQAIQPSLYPSQENGFLLQVTNRPGINGLAGMLGKTLIYFVHL